MASSRVALASRGVVAGVGPPDAGMAAPACPTGAGGLGAGGAVACPGGGLSVAAVGVMGSGVPGSGVMGVEG